MKLVVMSILIALLSISLLQAGTIKGLIKDADTGDPLTGANIVLGKTMMGTITDDDGFFILQDVPLGKWQLTASYLGYIDVTQPVIVGKVDIDLEIEMQPTVFKGQEVIVEVNRAEDRKTPVTFTEIDDTELMERYTTQDVPDLLKTTPGVFVSSAGLGEAEIFIRGFDAEHIQVLINGIPTNDPESQVVYWSNWTGLSGNASSIQIQ
ncbi:MAG: TonB-dependent receptor, partial [Calditrichia bacterium]|nr:TonB-dependent receptor [Calditrichia bacterium]